jgi:formate-nitrite transporter family protein
VTEHEAEGDSGTADLSPDEEKKATEEEKFDAPLTHEVVRREGMKELHRSASALAWSGLAGGLAVGLSVFARAVLHEKLPETTWRPLVTAFGYAVGFLVVVLGSQQLYTTNTLTPIVPLMAERTRDMLRKVVKLWSIVLVANLVGAFLFAWAAARTTVFTSGVRHAIHALALHATDPAAMEIFASAIVAGFIVALMTWMLPAAKEAHVWVIVAMAWLIGAGELAHVIVGSVEAFYLLVLGDISFGRAVGGYILPALLGNTIGGVALVATVNHAQVESDSGA